jgi:homoserine dehydrogenase
VFGVTTPLDAIDREGITRISVDDVARAKSAGEHWKLVGTIENRDGQLTTSVRPQRLPAAHPLAGVSGATNALVYTTRYLNDVTMIGPGAGRMETGFAVLQDLFSMYRDDRD